MKINLLFITGIMLSTSIMHAQPVNFELTTSPNIDFKFNTIEKYINGITLSHALDLNVNATGAEWDLYIGTTTQGPGVWNLVTSYSSTGNATPSVGILQARVYNTSNTSLTGTGFFPLTDIATPTYIIGSVSDDPAVNCSDPSPVGTNVIGDYLADPSCYKFRVDLKLVPGLIYQPGLYTLRVDFIVIPDL